MGNVCNQYFLAGHFKDSIIILMKDNPRHSPIQYLKGIGPKRAEAFMSLGINTVYDLLYYFPRRYEDRTNIYTIEKLKFGETQAVRAKVVGLKYRNSWQRRAFNITEVLFQDKTGRLSCVWFNQPYIKSYLVPGIEVVLCGRVEIYAGKIQMNNPEFEIIKDALDEELGIGRLVPVYKLPQGFSQRMMRRLVKFSLDNYISQISDCLPYDIRKRRRLFNLAQSLIGIHFPLNIELQKEAHRRLSFEEFFLFQLPLVLLKRRKKEKKGVAHKVDAERLNEFLGGLGFALTKSQAAALEEIKRDMSSPFPMQRLLQGDVGSGKTVVAVAAAVIAAHGGYQAAFMAPTEILTRQHYETIKRQVEESKARIRVAHLSGSLTSLKKEGIKKNIRNGRIDIVVGTHALLQEEVAFKNLGVVIIDEQHKFGVSQRMAIARKSVNPDLLIMTATPIPRTLAITLYGNLDISVISELPPGRPKVKTIWFVKNEASKAYSLAKDEILLGRQVFIVYPVIEESFALDISGAKKMYEDLKSQEFKDFNVGLIHGKLGQEEQNEIMLKFKEGKLDVLVSTTILEVGIDIPNATCIIVEHAERFGLSQLHQLRGRIGRGKFDSLCVLISDAETKEAKARILAMVRHSSGFKIAEEDLKIRGPGEFFGREQHGLSELKLANPLTQMQLLKIAREEAIKVISADPLLSQRPNILLKERIMQKFPQYSKMDITA